MNGKKMDDSTLKIGIDLGTSSLKVTILTPEGTVLSSAAEDYPILTPQPSWV